MIRGESMIPRRRRHVTILTLWVGLGASLAQSTPQFVKLQGSLSQTGVGPVTGTVSMTYSLYDVPSGGATLAVVGPLSVTVSQGLYEVELPLPQSVFSGPNRYVE